MKVSFELLLEALKCSTFEELVEGTNVECFRDLAYLDGDLETFLDSFGAEVVEYNDLEIGDGYANIVTESQTYNIFYESVPNRFGVDLPNEIILHFDEITIDN